MLASPGAGGRRPILSLALLTISGCVPTDSEQPAPSRASASLAASSPFDGAPAPAPRVFSPGVVSTGDYELNAAFSRDLRQVFFCKASPRFPFPNTWSVVLESRWSDGRWTEPQMAAFSGTYSDIDPYFSPDFERIYYMSNRPRSGVVPEDFDLWYVARADDGWSEPIHTGPAVNSEAMDGYPAIAEDGTLYFFSNRPGGYGPADIYAAEPSGESWGEAENLGPAINSHAFDTNVYVAPDESYMVFSSSRRSPAEDLFSRLDLYVSFRRDGTWQPAESLGDAVNTPGWEYTPMVSPDQRFLFFTRTALTEDRRYREGNAITHRELLEVVRGPGNGLGDLYYVELAALREEWRP